MVEDAAAAEKQRTTPLWMVASATVAGLVGAVLLVLGIIAFGEASEADDEAAAFAAEQKDLENELDDLVQEQMDLDEKTGEFDTRAQAVANSISEQIDAGNAVIDALNRVGEVFGDAVQAGNSGDTARERAIFQNYAEPILVEAETALDEQARITDEFSDLVARLGQLFR